MTEPIEIEIKAMWELESALAFVRNVEGIIQIVNCHSAFTGSVLYYGQSHKDLDVVIYPHNSTNPPHVCDVLNRLVDVLTPINFIICTGNDRYARDGKKVVSFFFKHEDMDRRVDFFFVEFDTNF